MTILFFDTETTGLPLFKERSAHPEQPHCVQLAYQTTDDAGAVKNSVSVIIDNAVDCPKEAFDVHGISREMANSFGVSPLVAVELFLDALKKPEIIVGHNVQFDLRIMRIFSERMGLRADIDAAVTGKTILCTMRMAKPIVQCPLSEKQQARGMGGYKNPRLEEAYKHFFGKDMENAHDALADVTGCREIYFHMKNL